MFVCAYESSTWKLKIGTKVQGHLQLCGKKRREIINPGVVFVGLEESTATVSPVISQLGVGSLLPAVSPHVCLQREDLPKFLGFPSIFEEIFVSLDDGEFLSHFLIQSWAKSCLLKPRICL